MVKGPGRDQRAPMERLVRIAAALHVNRKLGVDGETLAAVAGFDGVDKMTQLKRELRHLENQGWQIENIAPAGATAQYRMTTVDNRLRVRLTPGQQAALRTAALLADRGDLAQRLGLPDSSRPAEVTEPQVAAPSMAPAVAGARPEALTLVLEAVRGRCLLQFGYKGVARVVHPESIRNQNGVWYFRGVEDSEVSSGVVKTFVVSRMVEVRAGVPGSARAVESVRHQGLHPMSWEIDEPIEVTLATSTAFEPDVRRWLGEPVSSTVVDDEVRMTYSVTHRAALRARLYELGRRVRVIGPEEIRSEMAAELAAAARIGQ